MSKLNFGAINYEKTTSPTEYWTRVPNYIEKESVQTALKPNVLRASLRKVYFKFLQFS